MFIVYRYEDVQQMLRDNETFSSSVVIAAFGDVLGKHVMLGHGRARARPAAGAGVKGVLAEGIGALGGRTGRAGRQRADRQVRVERQRGSGARSSPSYPTQIIAGLLGLPSEDYPAVSAVVDLVAELHHEPGARQGGLGGAGEYFAPILAAVARTRATI